MQDFEKLGAFYLGRRFDAETKATTKELVLYDSKDLSTHAVIIGMTGSGKTGLGIGMIEEAALDHIPVIAIDPKGDLGNLLLSFPRLRGEDFAPWVDPRAATEQGQTPAEFAAAKAKLWREGLQAWGQTPARIKALHAAAEMAIYTPGSSAGMPVSVLKEFSPPTAELLADRDLYRDRLQGTATSLLTLIDLADDPLSSPEHILITSILDKAWQAGKSLDLAGLIAAVQDPGIDRVGVMELDNFFPPKDRFAFALKLNNLLAAPGFDAWMQGETMNIDGLLYNAAGKPRVSVMSIAHLSDAERMFFVTLLLTELLGWMRSQPGSGSLRAILYMDEIFGYMPPVANPPSKQPLLTLLKQARAYGLGLVLATQNPVDLDYKGLSNTGTWFIGRLQTKRDKARVREGLLGASGANQLNPETLDKTLAGLGKRRFLLHNVHESEPVLFETRWVMSYLAGPLTRDQIKQLSKDQTESSVPDELPQNTPKLRSSGARPVLDPDIREVFLPSSQMPSAGETLVYYPSLLAAGSVNFFNASLQINQREDYLLTVDPDDESGDVDWADDSPLMLKPSDLDTRPDPDAGFAELPACLGRAKQYKTWDKDLKRWLRANRALVLFKSAVHKTTSKPGETQRDFRIRLQQLGNDKRDLKVAKLRESYEKKVATLEDRLRRAQQTLEKQAEQASGQKLDAALSLGTAVLGALLGRKRISATSASRVGTAVRKAGRIGQESGDVRRAEESVRAVQKKLAELEQKFDDDVAELESAYDAQTEELKEKHIRPRVADVQVSLLALGWVPYLEDHEGGVRRG